MSTWEERASAFRFWSTLSLFNYWMYLVTVGLEGGRVCLDVPVPGIEFIPSCSLWASVRVSV